MAQLIEKLDKTLAEHKIVLNDPKREKIIQESLDNKEACLSANGALVTWTPPESTGRSPKDTVLVKRPESENTIDWTSPNCIPITPETFDMAWEDAMQFISEKEKIYVSNRTLIADLSYGVKVKTVCDQALHTLFTYN
ncbi:MAG: phosphoenolpyruvate carboxykinase (ATP), partial [Candidatus Heimdallarchaeota archaeon]